MNKSFIASCEIDGKQKFSTVINISKTGLGIYIEGPVQIGKNVTITLEYEYTNGVYSEESLNLILPGRIMWILEESPDLGTKTLPKEVKDKKYRAGIELLELSEDSQIKYDALF